LSASFLLQKYKDKILKNYKLAFVLYGCETWPLALREGGRLSVFENRLLRRIFGPKMEEVIEKWRKLYTEELSDLCISPNIVQVIELRRMI